MSRNYRRVKFIDLSMSSLGFFSDESSTCLDMMNDIGTDKKQQLYIIKKIIIIAISSRREAVTGNASAVRRLPLERHTTSFVVETGIGMPTLNAIYAINAILISFLFFSFFFLSFSFPFCFLNNPS